MQTVTERVLVFDGAMGTGLHARELSISDYGGHEGCPEVLVRTRPDVILDIHRSFLAVGCDAVLTNTFGANQVVLIDYDLADQTFELNKAAAELACRACRDFERPGRPRFAVGSIGPGTRLPTLGQITWDELVQSYREQTLGLLAGGVDAVVIETCQDILQAKSAIVAAGDAMTEQNREVPIFCTVTIQPTGTMLVGTDLAAAVTTIQAFDRVAAIGVNCATGPQEMAEHVHYLSSCCARPLIVQPNAGLPQLLDGQPHYDLTPEEFAKWMVEFVDRDGVSIVGGCCGTTPEHLAAVVDALDGHRPKTRRDKSEPALSSVYQSVTFRQENTVLMIGERTNANGSKRFRELLAEDDFDGMLQVARQQIDDGSHLLDVCTAQVGRDEERDMIELIRRLAVDITAPLVIDSTEPAVIEAALKLLGGKAIINSINLEDGEEKAAAVCRLARRYGAALIALTIDEAGMAKTCSRKVEIARRLYELAVNRHGLHPEDLIFDPLTFTVGTGNPQDSGLALETLDAVAEIKSVLPNVHTLLGVSNVSFGLKPPVRRVLNSVFLHHAQQRGLDAAILHPTGILPLHSINEHHRRLAEDLIFNRRSGEYDPLAELLEALADAPQETARVIELPPKVEDRLRKRIISGERRDLAEDLDEALGTHTAEDIINDILFDGMNTVGDLFGAGQTQLPFVLRSAETMKAAVQYLEPHMSRDAAADKGTLVLATVRGDVHDIGKNLVDIILTNNGYTVHDLGIKQPISNIIKACNEYEPDAIGMSGLLVKSTVVMRENLQTLNEHGITTPVILGGAALTRRFVEQDLRAEYGGPVYFAKDAFAGLRLMDEITTDRARASAAVERLLTPIAGAVIGNAPPAVSEIYEAGGEHSEHPEYIPPRSDISRDEPVPEPPFWGARVLENVPIGEVAAHLDEKALFQVHWQYRKNRRSLQEYGRFLDTEVRPILCDLLDRCVREDILKLQAVYGFWPAQAEGDSLVVYDPHDRNARLTEFEFPRMGKPPYWCISDFFRPADGGVFDVVAFMLVTAGRRVGEVAHDLRAANRYQDYLHLHGLGVEMTEALAEYLHQRIRTEWGIGGNAPEDQRKIGVQSRQGSRYSFGYPACPRLEDQVKLWPLLEPERLGVSLSETCQLEPEQTATALIAHHRQAKYFSVS